MQISVFLSVGSLCELWNRVLYVPASLVLRAAVLGDVHTYTHTHIYAHSLVFIHTCTQKFRTRTRVCADTPVYVCVFVCVHVF